MIQYFLDDGHLPKMMYPTDHIDITWF